MSNSVQDYQRVADAIGFLVNHRQQQPSLAELASHCGLSPQHFQRLFSRWAGISPKRFLQLLTVERAKQLLDDHHVLGLSDELGLSSGSRLYDHFVQLEAASPGEFKSGGQGLTIEYAIQASPFGEVFIARSPRGICSLQFLDAGGEAAALQSLATQWPKALIYHNPTIGADDVAAIFASGVAAGKPISLHVRGTNFQVSVWRALLRIPPSHFASYGQIAKALDKPRASRAVGTAVGANPIAMLIPCHRVIQQSGALGGYRWGLNRKQAIHVWEAARGDGERSLSA